MKAVKEMLHNLYVEHTGQPLERIKSAMERDNFMSPEEAKEFGLIDHVLRPPVKAASASTVAQSV